MIGLRRFGWCSFLWLLVAALVVTTGCSKSSLIPVTGTVTLDGKPLDGAAISFVPAIAPDSDTAPAGQTPATGQTDASGKFTLGSVAGVGAVQGTYKVGVSKAAAGAKVTGGDAPKGAPPGTMLSGGPGTGKPPAMAKNLVPDKYVNPDTSGITVEVKPGMEPVTIALTSG